MSASDFWNKRYQTQDYLFGVEPNDFIRITAPAPEQGATAFAPADGEGRNGVYLAKLGYQVTSVDVSNLAVDKAHALADQHGVTLDAHVGDVFDFPLIDDYFDLIVISFMHFMPDDHDDFIKRMKTALKPSGLLIMEGYTIDQMPFNSGGPKNPDMLYTREQIAEDFDDFDILILQETRRFLTEGTRHQGEAATLQLMAQKPS